MTDTRLPSPELLCKLLRYEPETGKLFWRERGREFFRSDRACNAFNAARAGKEAFTADNGYGYRQGSVLSRNYKAHRVIWAMQTGKWPTQEVDHIDRDKGNNAWSNLRPASKSQNSANKPVKPNSSSKYMGVSWHKCSQKWIARINDKRHQIHLGIFDCEIEAARAYDKFAKKIHGDFGVINFPDDISCTNPSPH